MIQYSLTSYLQFNIICSYIYDGWNLIREKTVGLATEDRGLQTAKSLQFTVYSLKSYFWGLDVSGSLGGAGGVGGLLQLAVVSNSPYITKLSAEALAKERQKTDLFGPSSQKSEINNLKLYFPHYDHIGNIIAYTNESEEIAAVYDYSGFGELIRSDGSMKEDFSLQFSTKYIDKETNLYYYGLPEIFNTDQGSQFTGDDFTGILDSFKIAISNDGKGRALDNVYIERLWRSLKYENIFINCYESITELKKGIDRYFKFYNSERFHQSLNYNTPDDIYLNNSEAVDAS